MIKIKYLKGLVKLEDTPWYWNPNDNRQEFWKNQREEYGFDERETWSLEYTFRLWFYQRLKMYNEINIVATDKVQIEFKDKKYTLQECIDYILEMFELTFKNDMWDYNIEQFKKVHDTYRMIGEIMPYLWW